MESLRRALEGRGDGRRRCFSALSIDSGDGVSSGYAGLRLKE